MNGKSFIWKTVPCYIMPCKRLKVEGVRMKKSMRSSVSHADISLNHERIQIFYTSAK